MSIKSHNPYIHFSGTAEKALGLYESALGAEIGEPTRYGDVPGLDVPEAHKHLIVHAELRIGGNTLMLNDTPPDQLVPLEGNVDVCFFGARQN